MKPIFTVHAGEYLVGSHIERNFKGLTVWIPSRDTGVDLLITDRRNRRTVSLQVKFGKDWTVTHTPPKFRSHLKGSGWWNINRKKLEKSAADFWVFVLFGFLAQSIDYVIVPKADLFERMTAIHSRPKIIQTFLWVTNEKRCYETRGLTRSQQWETINTGVPQDPLRDFTVWLNDWNRVLRSIGNEAQVRQC